MSARASVSLLRACDNACAFCGVDGLDRSGPRPVEEVHAELRALRAAHAEVSFVGGEPLLDPAIVDHVAHAKGLGFARVGLQTNARRLAITTQGDRLADRLAAAGLDDVHVSIHGAEPAVHDYHTGVDGSLAQSLAGVAAARARKLGVVATTVLTRSNFRVIGAIPRLLSVRGISAWVVSVPHARGRAGADFDRVMPRLGLAVPFALHAIADARRRGLPAWIAGAPRCLLGPMGAHAIAIDAQREGRDDRAYAAACEGCGARATCPGLDAAYLARFDGDEIAPRPSADPVLDHAPLRAPFVGAGQLADAPALRVSPPPAKARVDLPMLGKVQPARAEVPRSAGKKTGEALREILPALFGEGEPREGTG